MTGLTVSLNLMETFGLAVLVLLFGRYLVTRINVLEKFCIPAPVVGGILFSLLTLLGYATGAFSIKMDTALQPFFMNCFFTTVGFGASLAILKRGGPAILIFLLVATVLCVLQSGVGAGLAVAMGESPLLGLAAGSISMTGGHGTSGAFGPLLEKEGLVGGTTIAIAAATFGLVSGSLIGGPTGRRLIEKFKLTVTGAKSPMGGLTAEEALGADPKPFSGTELAIGFFQIAVAAGIGSVVSGVIQLTGITLPSYIGAMLVAAVFRNVFPDGTKYEMRLHEIHALGEIFLGVFLAYALMSLRLWELASLAIPLTVILVAQVSMMFLYATYVTFPLTGKDYDAAVIAAGHCGFGLGATPNGIANMNAVVHRYGPSPKAFFVLPLVGCLFIDFINAMIITFYINVL
ncbi:MAG: Sodium/glutamate symporter [Desulfovibrio sp.]